jgi:hypothetical protein
MTMLHVGALFHMPCFIDENLILLAEKFFSMSETWEKESGQSMSTIDKSIIQR